MWLAKLKNFKFSDLNFYHYFFTAYIGLHVTFSILLGNITAFAPDENTYRNLFNKFYISGFDILPNTVGFGDEIPPILFLRLLYLPAKILNIFGMNDLISLRLQAIFYSALALYLVSKIAKSNNRDILTFRVGLVLISFIPSVFLWSSISLRESFLFLEISAILYFLDRVKSEFKLLNLAGLGISLLSLALTKNYIYILFLFSFILICLLFSIFYRKKILNHIAILFLSLVPLVVNPTLVPAVTSYFSGQLETTKEKIVGDLNNDGVCSNSEPCDPIVNILITGDLNNDGVCSNSEPCDPSVNVLIKEENLADYVATRGMTTYYLLEELRKNPKSLVAKISSYLGITDKLHSISISSFVLETDKEAIKNKEKLTLQQAGLRNPVQILRSALEFLFLPILFIDNGSLFLNLQSLESPVWIVIYVFFIVSLSRMFRRKITVTYSNAIASIFALEFLGISTLIEVNVGTALRHRSLLLIPILVIWASREKKSVSI